MCLLFGLYLAWVFKIHFQWFPHSRGPPRALKHLWNWIVFFDIFNFSFKSWFSIAYLGYGYWPHEGAIYTFLHFTYLSTRFCIFPDFMTCLYIFQYFSIFSIYIYIYIYIVWLLIDLNGCYFSSFDIFSLNIMLRVFFSPGRNRACRHCWILFWTPSGKRLL